MGATYLVINSSGLMLSWGNHYTEEYPDAHVFSTPQAAIRRAKLESAKHGGTVRAIAEEDYGFIVILATYINGVVR